MDLGQTCLNLYRVTPGGVLVFFPSYPFLKSCMEYWQENGIWDKMAALKVRTLCCIYLAIENIFPAHF